MHTDSGLWGWQSVTAPLNPALINPLDAPNCRWRDVMWAGIATSKVGDAAEEGNSNAISASLTAGAEASGTAIGSWGSGLEMVVVGVWWCFLGRVGQRTQGNVIWLPTGACTDLLPLILLLLPLSSSAPPSPVTVPPPSAHLLFLIDPNPEKNGIIHKDQAQKTKKISDRISWKTDPYQVQRVYFM